VLQALGERIFGAGLCSSLKDLRDARWQPNLNKSLRSRERLQSRRIKKPTHVAVTAQLNSSEFVRTTGTRIGGLCRDSERFTRN
jgi:hypothetical protein